MPDLSRPDPPADGATDRHPARTGADAVAEDWDRCVLGNEPVLPDDVAVSGWHSLLSLTYAVEQWFWDAAILAWREWPRALIAETAHTLGCEGYAYLAAIMPPP